jgi:hypothetical protein
MDETDYAMPPSANGILQCLKLLAAEAASLKLSRTLSAIEDALEMAASESGLDTFGDVFEDATRHVLH